MHPRSNTQKRSHPTSRPLCSLRDAPLGHARSRNTHTTKQRASPMAPCAQSHPQVLMLHLPPSKRGGSRVHSWAIRKYCTPATSMIPSQPVCTTIAAGVMHVWVVDRLRVLTGSNDSMRSNNSNRGSYSSSSSAATGAAVDCDLNHLLLPNATDCGPALDVASIYNTIIYIYIYSARTRTEGSDILNWQPSVAATPRFWAASHQSLNLSYILSCVISYVDSIYILKWHRTQEYMMLLQTLNPKLNNPKVKPLIMTVSCSPRLLLLTVKLPSCRIRVPRPQQQFQSLKSEQ